MGACCVLPSVASFMGRKVYYELILDFYDKKTKSYVNDKKVAANYK